MKKIIFLTVAFLIIYCNTISSQERNTLWLEGIGSGATSWQQTKNTLKNTGFDFKDLHTVGVNGNWKPELGIEAASNRLNNDLDEENILGIAHDYGGIVLRHLQLQNSNISAMILDGVPNQGSSAIEYTTKKFLTGSSLALEMLDDVLDFRKDSDCDEDCGYISNFSEFLEGMVTANENSILEDIYPQGNVIQNLEEPTVPFVIFYGTIEQNSILELMNTQADQLGGGGEDFYSSCYLENLREEEMNAKDAFTKSTLGNVLGFTSDLFAAIKTAVSATIPLASLINSVSSILTTRKDQITEHINALAEKDEELARLAKCELSHQLLQAQWEIQLMQNSNVVSESTTGPDVGYCAQYCENEGWEDNLGLTLCIYQCEQENTTTTYTLILEDNDGLLTKSEQILEGSVVPPYHLKNTDHMEETNLESGDDGDKSLGDHFSEIFNGAAGPEFLIPKT
jgi:hypothetical protein